MEENLDTKQSQIFTIDLLGGKKERFHQESNPQPPHRVAIWATTAGGPIFHYYKSSKVAGLGGAGGLTILGP